LEWFLEHSDRIRSFGKNSTYPMNPTNRSHVMRPFPRAWRFLQKPLHEKSRSFYARWRQVFPHVPVPVRLPFGAWWIARNDSIGETLSYDGFENPERCFVERFLKPGMTVLDIGAHHGFYTLLASKRVGPQGRVIAFEPSPRERKALLFHVRLNLCWNVNVQGLALGNEHTQADLYVVEGSQTGCNSLRPPIVVSETSSVRVPVTRLDDWLGSQGFGRVDFMKMDVEGGELQTLQGAAQLLRSSPRPVILAELQNVRTKPWGYCAREIVDYLASLGYEWFGLTAEGLVKEMDLSCDEFEGNFVACPGETTAELERVRPPNFTRPKVEGLA
jgi:FkbM family methyltransferase